MTVPDPVVKIFQKNLYKLTVKRPQTHTYSNREIIFYNYTAKSVL